MLKAATALAVALALAPAGALAAACGPTYGADGLVAAGDGGVWLTHYEDARLAFRAADGGWRQWESRVGGEAMGLSGLRLDPVRKLAWAVAADGGRVVRLDLDSGAVRAIAVDGLILGHRGPLAGDGQGGVWVLAATPAADGLTAPTLWRLDEGGSVAERRRLPADAITSAAMAVDAAGMPLVVLHRPGEADAELVVGDRRTRLGGVGKAVPGMVVASGALWLAAPERNALAEWRDGRLRLHPLPTAAALPVTVAPAADGSVWVTEWDGRKLARFHPHRGWREYPVPEGEDAPIALAFADDGAVWFSTLLAYDLFRLDSATGRTSRHPVPPPAAEAAEAPFATCHLAAPAAETTAIRARPASRHARDYPDAAAQLFEQSCHTACHTWFRVEQAAQRRRDWGATVDRMVEANGAAVLPAQRDRVVDYLNRRYTREQP
ncbi:MAG: hypothetical protein ACM31D_19800 [Bacteroidota bacterium]